MAITLVQNKPIQQTATNHAVTLDVAPTTGNLLIALFGAATTLALTTPPSGFTEAAAIDNSVLAHYAGIWFKVAGAGESATQTFVTTTSVTSGYDLLEVSGLDSTQASVLDKVNEAESGGASSNTYQPGSTGELSQADEFVATICKTSAVNGGTEAIDSGFTILDTATFTIITCGYQIVSATTALNPTHSWVSNGRRAAAIASFKAAGGAAAFVRPTIVVAPGTALHQAANW